MKVLNEKNNIWFSSDFHYGHKNIVRGLSRWESGYRDFDTMDQHNTALLKGINDNVGHDDILIFLGDFAMGGRESIKRFREQIICQNIHLILGNHDEYIESNWNNCQELFTDVTHQKELHIKVDGQQYHFNMNHNAKRVWNKSHKGSIMLYGHSHGSLPEYGDDKGKFYKTMDVGVDTHPEFRPYSLGEILKIMDKRIVLENLDHHNKRVR